MVNLKKLNNAKGIKVSLYKTETIDSAYIKKVREKYALTQNELSIILDVSVKTIEKWEESNKTIKGPSSILLSLIYNHEDIAKLLFNYTIVESEETIVSAKSNNSFRRINRIIK